MRLKLKYRNWQKAKKFIISKKFLVWAVIIVTVLIFISAFLILASIYTKDKPAFIPAETRGAIREGIKEEIAKPLAAVIPGLGNPFYNAAWTYKNNDSFTNSNNFDGEKNNGYAKWKTYKNEELGFEIKYPENYQLTFKESSIDLVEDIYRDYQSDYPKIIIMFYNKPTDFYGLNSWINSNKSLFIGDQEIDEVEGFTERGTFKINSIAGLQFDWFGYGKIRSYVFEKNNKIFAVEVLGTEDNSMITIAENIIGTIK